MKLSYSQIAISLTALLLLIGGCQPGPKQQAATIEHEHHPPHSHEESQEEGLAVFSARQIATMGITTGDFQEMKLAGYIKANGILDLPPSNQAYINPPHKGFVERTEYLEGDYVRKGALLLELSHPDYLQLQQSYMETCNRLVFLEKEWERQKTLAEANVSARKKLQETEAEFQGMKSRKLGIGERLSYLGISTDLLDQGKMQRSIVIRAPFSGYITSINIRLGELVLPETAMYEMVDNTHLHLELRVFEKDWLKLKIGQRITFHLPTQDRQTYQGEVHLIGREFDQDNRTVGIHGHLLGEHPAFIKGSYVEARIWLNDQVVPALPESAIVREDGQSYIFAEVPQSENEGSIEEIPTTYRQIMVRTGLSEKGFIETYPLEEMAPESRIVISGAYYLLAELSKGEGGHAH